MKRIISPPASFGLSVFVLLFLTIVGCELGSVDDVVRQVGVDFSGFYVGTREDGYMTSRNSGWRVRYMILRQNGDQLEAVDNNEMVFRGRLGNVLDTTASFTLEGSTTAGKPVTISGTLQGEGTSATMQGTWIEPEFYAIFSGRGTINPSPTGGVTTLTIEPSSVTLTANGNTQVFTARGGVGPYNWSLLNMNGTLNTMTGTSVIYTRKAAGDNRITVTDSTTKSASATITQP